MLSALRAAAGTAAIAICLPAMLIVGFPITVPIDYLVGNRRVAYAVGRGIMNVVWFLAGTRVVEVGREHIVEKRPRVLVTNHTSMTDIPLILTLLPGRSITLIKREAFRVPILGWSFRLVHFVPVERDNPVAARESFEQAVRIVAGGESIVVAPEGTRSRDGKLGRFKKGAFLIAARTGAPVIPVTVTGAERVLRPGSWMIWPATVRVRYHEPIPTDGIASDDRSAISRLAERTREIIRVELDRIRAAPADC